MRPARPSRPVRLARPSHPRCALPVRCALCALPVRACRARPCQSRPSRRISPRALSCVFLSFPEDSSDYTFYHPPLHQFFDSHDVIFDESIPYYVRYPCRGLPVPPAPLFLTSAPPHAPPVQPPPLGPAPSADPAGAGFRGEDPGGASSIGAGVGAESVPVQDPGSGGAGVGAEPVTAGDSSLRGAGVSGAVPGGATIGGAPSAGPGEPGTDPITSGGVGSGGGATGSLESGPGATTAPDTTPPPHPYPTQHQARQRPPPPISGLRTLSLPSPSPPSPSSPPVSSPPLPPPDPSPTIFPPPLPPLSPPLSHTWPSRHSPRARPLSPVPFTDLCTALFRSSLPCLSPSFASTRYLDYATRLVAAPPTSPLAVRGESALGCDALEDRQFELEFLAAASPHLCAMLLAPEGDPDALDIPTPRTYAEAVSMPWASQWRAAMDSEMASYRSTGTYVDEVPPLGANVVDGMWIFRVKRPPGSPPVFKARYVARGFSQREVAYTRRSGYVWHDTLRSTLSDLGFQPSYADPSLFVRRGSTPFFVLVCVDDLVFATADRVALADLKLELQKRHTCTDLGDLRHYLGLQITRDRAARTITPSQSHMVQQVLQRFELQHSTVQRTPLAVDHRLTGPFLDEPFEPSGPYAELVGCLMVAKYLATTSGVGLVLGGRQDVVLTGHCGSSYADESETHRSTQGYCFSLGSGAVSWRSTRSSSVSTSTAEAEIYAGAMAA
ncbi:unnamed protein product [Closterium sp. NIES-54]